MNRCIFVTHEYCFVTITNGMSPHAAFWQQTITEQYRIECNYNTAIENTIQRKPNVDVAYGVTTMKQHRINHINNITV